MLVLIFISLRKEINNERSECNGREQAKCAAKVEHIMDKRPILEVIHNSEQCNQWFFEKSRKSKELFQKWLVCDNNSFYD